MAIIPGGYYLKARCIQNSEIAVAPPHVREIWDWLLKEANHKDQKKNGKLIKRGQTMRTYKDIQEGLYWKVGFRKMTYTKWQIEGAMKLLRKLVMITTAKTTRGVLVTIVNYDFYQNPSNYNGQREPQREPQQHHTINNNDKNVKNKEDNLSYNCKSNSKKKDYVSVPFQEQKKTRVKHYNNVWLDLENSEWYIDDDIYETWERKYPDIDIDLELQRMSVWLQDHKDVAHRHELKRTYPFFCVDWFKRAENKINERDKSVEEVRSQGSDEFSEMLARESFNMEG